MNTLDNKTKMDDKNARKQKYIVRYGWYDPDREMYSGGFWCKSKKEAIVKTFELLSKTTELTTSIVVTSTTDWSIVAAYDYVSLYESVAENTDRWRYIGHGKYRKVPKNELEIENKQYREWLFCEV